MPCRSDYPDEGLSAEERETQDVTTRLACEYCHYLENHKGPPVPSWAKVWWARHKAIDELRTQREMEEAQTRNLRKRALAKLTREERKLLGVD
jgi:hypothetical protein